MGSKYPPQGKNASRHETLGSRNLMEQFTSVRAKVDMYFGKVSVLILCEASRSPFNYSHSRVWDSWFLCKLASRCCSTWARC